MIQLITQITTIEKLQQNKNDGEFPELNNYYKTQQDEVNKISVEELLSGKMPDNLVGKLESLGENEAAAAGSGEGLVIKV